MGGISRNSGELYKVVIYTKWFIFKSDLCKVKTSKNNCEIWEKLLEIKKKELGEYIETILFINSVWRELISE